MAIAIKKRRATAIRHQGSPQAHLLIGRSTYDIRRLPIVGSFFARVHFEVVILMTLSKYFQMSCIRLPDYNANITHEYVIIQIPLRIFSNIDSFEYKQRTFSLLSELYY